MCAPKPRTRLRPLLVAVLSFGLLVAGIASVVVSTSGPGGPRPVSVPSALLSASATPEGREARALERRHALSQNAPRPRLRRIALLADEVQFDENRTLIREGTRGREFFVVVEGVLRVTRNGRKVSVLGAGDFVGELALVADVPRTATVTASTPVHLLVLTHRGFLDLLDQSPSITVKVLQSLGERLHSDASSTRSVTI